MYSDRRFLFYDLETSGLNKAFDQVQQCAIKIMDSHWAELDQLFFEVRLSPDTIPSPYATITHRISLVGDEGRLSEVEAIANIHKVFNTPGSISLGYNTLGFDDEFLRFSFYRNLLSPYTHQYASGCGRMDVFPMTVFYFLYAKDAISWPHIDEKVSLKLEALAAENGWDSGRAHHAMHDVDATIILAKALQSENPQMWDYLSGFFQKNEDKLRIEKLEKAVEGKYESYLGLMISAKLGANQHFQAPVLSLGVHKVYKNQLVWLRLDKIEIKEGMTYNNLLESGCILKKKFGEPPFLLPWTKHYAKHLGEERKETAKNNLTMFKSHAAYYKTLVDVATKEIYPRIEHIDIDAALYEKGFRTAAEDTHMRRLHDQPFDRWHDLLDHLPDKGLMQQAIRCLWRHNPVLLSSDQKIEAEAYCRTVWHGAERQSDHTGLPRRSLACLEKEMNEVCKMKLDPEQKALIDELSEWMKKQVPPHDEV